MGDGVYGLVNLLVYSLVKKHWNSPIGAHKTHETGHRINTVKVLGNISY